MVATFLMGVVASALVGIVFQLASIAQELQGIRNALGRVSSQRVI